MILLQSPSKSGKANFVSCSKWKKGEDFEHLYAPIPSRVNKDVLFQLMNGQEVTEASSADIHLYERKCATIHHPRHGKQKFCNHIHFENGHLVTKRLVPRKCNVRKIVYIPKDPNIHKLVVFFNGIHNHPVWPNKKPTQEAKSDLKKCLDACGVYGITGGQLDYAPLTIALLGVPLSEKHDAYRNKKVLSESVKEHKLVVAPGGLQWEGVIHLYNEDQKRPKEERYFWHLRMDEHVKVVATANSTLANLIHDALYLACDFTFKRTQGELNEWEAAIFHLPTQERVTVVRIYCNASSADAFTFVWEGFFDAVERSTGRKVLLKVFNPDGSILAILMDMEAAQVQGLGKALMQLGVNDTVVSGIFKNDPMLLVQYILNLCSVHWDRSIDKLIGELGKDAVLFLNRFPALVQPSEFDDWHSFCKNHTNVNLKNWYEHKVTYPWLLPGYNKHLSRMPQDYWDKTPNHTNLVETAHVASNRFTGIGLSPVEAIMKARKFDEATAASIRKASETCILKNPHNNEISRMKWLVSRQVHQQKRQHEHQTLRDKIDDVRDRLTAASSTQKDLREQLKALNDQKKDAGRAPRHINATAPLKLTEMQQKTNQRTGGDEELELAVPPHIVPSNAPPFPEGAGYFGSHTLSGHAHLSVFDDHRAGSSNFAWDGINGVFGAGALGVQFQASGQPEAHPTYAPALPDYDLLEWQFNQMLNNSTWHQ